ncbi:MAG: restriction endonuclease [Polyangiaceae bacterium]
MAVPTYDKFIEPLLRYLAAHPEGSAARDAYDAVAQALKLSPADCEVLLPSGVQAVFKNRAGWAHDRLKRAGYSSSPRRGYWKLTEKGLELAAKHRRALPQAILDEIISSYNGVRLQQAAEQTDATAESPSDDVPTESQIPTIASPDDRLEAAVAELRESARRELMDTLSQVSPQFFEAIVLDVLHKLGYGTSRSDLQRVGRSGDGGIDGVISLDRLGLEKVHVQAKRWRSSVGRPEVQAFYGALAGQRANKGVFITTSTFTAQAIEFAKSVERIVLVDGVKLADLMIDFEVGITMRPVRVPKLDTDYFDEG